MPYKNLEKYFKQEVLSSNGENRFVIILGSGIHRQASDDKNILSDWHSLLRSVNKKAKITNDYVLDFENIICKHADLKKDKPALEVENELIKKIAGKLKSIDISKWETNYPLGIFNNHFVSDVINLNFDTKIEELITGKKNLQNKYSDYYDKNKKPLNSTLFHDVNSIRFWHPHGSVTKPDTILLGLRKYAHNSQEVEILRKRYKAKTREREKVNVQKTNWYDVLTMNPVIICGASMSTAEWDLWLAIVNRMRNYARNKQNLQPIFIMTGGHKIGECTAKGGEHFFSPITEKNLSFSEEWKHIEKLFK
jgi:hypothetical protein